MDTRTLVQAAMVLSIMSAFILFFVWKTQKTYQGFGYWVLQHVAMVMALPLLMLRNDATPPFVPVLMGNGLILLSCLLALEGVKRFFGKGHLGIVYWLAFALEEGGLYWFLYMTPSMGVRMLLVSLFLGTVSLIISWHLLFRFPGEVRLSSRLLGTIMSCYGLMMLVRGSFAVVWFPAMDFFAANSLQTATYLASTLVYLFATFGYIVVNSQRLGHEIEVTAEEVRRRERRVRREQAFLRKVIDTSPDHIYVRNLSGQFLLANESIARFFGLSVAQIVEDGRNLDSPRERVQHLSQRGIEAGSSGNVVHSEEQLLSLTGKPHSFSTIKVPLLNLEGSFDKLLCFATDITEHKEAERKLELTLENLRKAVGGTIQAIVQVVETRDPYTAGHQRRVADLARSIASEMGLSSDMIEGVRMAGVIHDIGKISVPAEILSKPGTLSTKEFELIKDHPQTGYDILKDVEFPWPIAEIAYQHHERLDGSGYPRGLFGTEILLEARIIAIADVVEAMASYRPYRPARTIDAALAEIEAQSGIAYDPQVTQVCLNLFRNKGYILAEAGSATEKPIEARQN